MMESFCAWLLEALAPESTSMHKEGLSKFVDNRLIKWVLKRTQGALLYVTALKEETCCQRRI